jgi:hypothetical protein
MMLLICGLVKMLCLDLQLANATVNNGGEHAVQERSGTASLTSGVYYPIRIQFGEAGGGDAMTFNYSTPTITKTDQCYRQSVLQCSNKRILIYGKRIEKRMWFRLLLV